MTFRIPAYRFHKLSSRLTAKMPTSKGGHISDLESTNADVAKRFNLRCHTAVKGLFGE